MNTTWTAYGLAAALATLAVVPTKAAGTAGAQFLKVAASARAVAMGSATSATSDDISSTQGNPAGLINIKDLQFTASHNQGLVDTQHQFVAVGSSFGDSAVALSVVRMSYGSIERYTASDARDGSFNAGSLAGGLTVAKKLNDSVSVGVTAKMVQESIDGATASTFAGDVGLAMKTNGWELGAALQHLGGGLKFVQETADLPTTARVSAARHFLDNHLMLAVEASKPRDNGVSLHGGAEYLMGSVVSFRGGYTATPGNQAELGGLVGLSGGLGLDLGRFTLDYGVQPFGDLGLSQRVSVSAHFARL